MTIEEAINELNLMEMACRTPKAAEAVKIATAALREQEKRRWIPVEERLPQEDQPLGALCEVVQVLLRDNRVTVGWCNRGLKCWYYLPIHHTKFVGHG